MKHLLFLVFAMLLFVSCEDTSTSKAPMQMEPEASVYVQIKLNHVNGVDVLSIEKIVHNEQGVVVKTITSIDTISSLSLVKDTLALVDKNGEPTDKDSIMWHPKDYSLFISVQK